MYHNMGFFHEQNRIDRDDFVEVIWENILAGPRNQFWKNQNPSADLPNCNPNNGPNFDDCDNGIPGETYGLPYDYQSIMHYGSAL